MFSELVADNTRVDIGWSLASTVKTAHVGAWGPCILVEVGQELSQVLCKLLRSLIIGRGRAQSCKDSHKRCSLRPILDTALRRPIKDVLNFGHLSSDCLCRLYAGCSCFHHFKSCLPVDNRNSHDVLPQTDCDARAPDHEQGSKCSSQRADQVRVYFV